jgi:hypothetical protein
MFLPVSKFDVMAAPLPLKTVMDFCLLQKNEIHAAQPPTGRRESRLPAA